MGYESGTRSVRGLVDKNWDDDLKTFNPQQLSSSVSSYILQRLEVRLCRSLGHECQAGDECLAAASHKSLSIYPNHTNESCFQHLSCVVSPIRVCPHGALMINTKDVSPKMMAAKMQSKSIPQHAESRVEHDDAGNTSLKTWQATTVWIM